MDLIFFLQKQTRMSLKSLRLFLHRNRPEATLEVLKIADGEGNERLSFLVLAFS